MTRALLCTLLVRLAAAGAPPDAGVQVRAGTKQGPAPAAKTPEEELLEALNALLSPPQPSDAAQAAGAKPAAPPKPSSALPRPAVLNLTVAGRLCIGLNGDGRCRDNEPMLAGVHLVAAGKQAQTDVEGRFLFEGLPGGASIAPANSFELPAGFAFPDPWAGTTIPGGGQRLALDLRVRPPRPLDDFGSYLVLHLPTGPLRLALLETTRFKLAEWSEGRELSARREKVVQRLGTEVLDAPDLRVLVVVEPPPGPAKAAYETAFRGARAALRYLQGLALVPRARLMWTLAEPGTLGGGAGHVDVLLVRVPAPRSERLPPRRAGPAAGAGRVKRVIASTSVHRASAKDHLRCSPRL